MAKVNAKCTNCGEIIVIDDEKDANVCTCCNSAFITKKAIKLYKKSPVKNDNSSKNVKRFFKTFGSVLLLILECIWTIICTIFCINLISDIASGSKKKK